jgi:hypothetical protein
MKKSVVVSINTSLPFLSCNLTKIQWVLNDYFIYWFVGLACAFNVARLVIIVNYFKSTGITKF